MNKSAVVIGLIFGLGGVVGLVKPREWIGTAPSRNASTGSWVVSKSGTRILCVGAILVGAGVLWIGMRNEN